MKVNFPNTGDAQFFIFYLLPFFFQRLFLLPEHPYGIYLFTISCKRYWKRWGGVYSEFWEVWHRNACSKRL